MCDHGELAKRMMRDHDEDTRQMNAIVCPGGMAGLEALALEIGCTRGALLDSIGHLASSPTIRHHMLTETESWPIVATKARAIDADRRERMAKRGRPTKRYS